MSVAVRKGGGMPSGRGTAGIGSSFPGVVHCTLVAAVLAVLAPRIACAETLPDALVRAYQGNPQLNAERAKLRSIDEGVPQALSGYRPQVTVGLSSGLISVRNLLPDNTSQSAQLKPWMAGITLNQTLFNGYKTGNTVRQVEAGGLVPAEPADRLLPHGRDEAIALARRENPAIVGTTYDVDAAQFAVSIAESGLYPTLGVQGNVSRNVQTDTTLSTTRTDQASIVGTLNMPIYDGGLAASQVRQAKETLTQNRVQLDRVRTQAETAAIAAWVTHEGAKISLAAAQAEVRASTIALDGVKKEALAGKRTTLEVLNSQQDLMQARARLIAAQQDRVVASYTLLSAIGRLDRAHLALNSPDYDPQTHYQQVRDVWHGLRTPSGQ